MIYITIDLNTIYSNHQLLKQTINETLYDHKIQKDIINIIISYYLDIRLISNEKAYALLSPDGTINTWGLSCYGGDSSSEQHLLKNIIDIKSTVTAFSALTENGNVIAWGEAQTGGYCINKQHELQNIKSIHAVLDCSFVAIRNNGSLISWGSKNLGNCETLVDDVKYIYSNGSNTFVAITSEGNGYISESSKIIGSNFIPCSEVQDQLTNISTIYHNRYSYTALKQDGSIVTWGDCKFGGNSSLVADKLKNVISIAPTAGAYIALLQNGTIVSWGYMNWRYLTNPLIYVQDKLHDIIKIYSTNTSYLALTKTGSVVTWGCRDTGGDCGIYQELLVNIVDIYANFNSFLAIRDDDTVITWGSVLYANGCVIKRENDKIVSVHKTLKSFAILYKSGSVVIIGNSEKTYYDIESVISCHNAYMFIKKNGMLEIKKIPLKKF